MHCLVSIKEVLLDQAVLLGKPTDRRLSSFSGLLLISIVALAMSLFSGGQLKCVQHTGLSWWLIEKKEGGVAGSKSVAWQTN